MSPTSGLGADIRTARELEGLTQTDLAYKIGRCPASVSRYESNDTDVSLDVLCAIVRACPRGSRRVIAAVNQRLREAVA
jgi:transcriptional regulator with XRE-family HTH domain